MATRTLAGAVQERREVQAALREEQQRAAATAADNARAAGRIAELEANVARLQARSLDCLH